MTAISAGCLIGFDVDRCLISSSSQFLSILDSAVSVMTSWPGLEPPKRARDLRRTSLASIGTEERKTTAIGLQNRELYQPGWKHEPQSWVIKTLQGRGVRRQAPLLNACGGVLGRESLSAGLWGSALRTTRQCRTSESNSARYGRDD